MQNSGASQRVVGSKMLKNGTSCCKSGGLDPMNCGTLANNKFDWVNGEKVSFQVLILGKLTHLLEFLSLI